MAPWLRRLLASASGAALLSLGPASGLRTHVDRGLRAPSHLDEETLRNRIKRMAASDVRPKSCHQEGDVGGCNETEVDIVPDLTHFMNDLQQTLGVGSSATCYEFDPPAKINKCNQSNQEQCDMTALRGRGPSSLVYPGGKTRCLNNSLPEYAFQVFPGDPDKLYIFFDGGGAQWDVTTTAVGLANKTHVIALKDVGLLMRGSDSPSPFKDHTIVVVQYCSGDLHSGNATMPYMGIDDMPVKQMGYHNTMSAVDWALANMKPKLKSLVISGISAGAIATEVWSFKLLNTFKYESARLLADSYVPVFPPDFEGKVFQDLGICSTGMLKGQSELQKECDAGTLNIQQVFSAAMSAYPDVGFASMASAQDAAQHAFYRVVLITKLEIAPFFSYGAVDFEADACKAIDRYSKNPNYVFYLMKGSTHILQMCKDVYDYSVQAGDGSSQPLLGWLKSFLEGGGTRSWRSAGEGPDSCKKLQQERPMSLRG